MKYLILILLPLMLLSGCAKGPEEAQLQNQLQAQLDSQFASGLFKVENFQRRGHQPYSQQDNSGIIVYYKTNLTFNRAHTLSNWDAKVDGSLVSILGATTNGIKGIEAAGNKANDQLTVHGFMTFSLVDDNWQLSSYVQDAFAAVTEQPVSAAPAVNEPALPQTVAEQLTLTITALEQAGQPDVAKALQADVATLVANYNAQIKSAEKP